MNCWTNTMSHSISSQKTCGIVEASISLMSALPTSTLEERERVILHELGHINHNPAHYKRLLYKYENDADHFMVCHLIAEELKEYYVTDFNWHRFAQQHKISTIWDETMIQEEFQKIVGI